MVKLAINQVREIMNDPDNIRNISIIAHFDNKQPALIKSLIEKTKIILDGSYREI